MDLMKYVSESMLIMIPVVYIIGMMIKGLDFVPDKYIPFILLVISIILCLLVNGLNVQSIIQAVLIVGVAVYTNQLIKQIQKEV
jgi:hypothetical protein